MQTCNFAAMGTILGNQPTSDMPSRLITVSDVSGLCGDSRRTFAKRHKMHACTSWSAMFQRISAHVGVTNQHASGKDSACRFPYEDARLFSPQSSVSVLTCTRASGSLLQEHLGARRDASLIERRRARSHQAPSTAFSPAGRGALWRPDRCMG